MEAHAAKWGQIDGGGGGGSGGAACLDNFCCLLHYSSYCWCAGLDTHIHCDAFSSWAIHSPSDGAIVISCT